MPIQTPNTAFSFVHGAALNLFLYVDWNTSTCETKSSAGDDTIELSMVAPPIARL